MKKYLICFLCFCILTSILYINPSWASGPLSNKIFVIDVGHGGVDPGTVVGEIYEKDINLKISLRLKEKLQNYGAKVILTRDGDYDLGTPNAYRRKKIDFDHRIKIINSSNADYYLSIHLNYLEDSSYFGPQVFYNEENVINKDLALKVQDYLNQNLSSKREIKKIPSRTYMYSRLRIPGILIECGFLSNPRERKDLQTDEYLDKLSMIIADSFTNI